MRGPLAKIPEQSILAFRFGAKLENLLFPEQINGEGGGDGVSESFAGNFLDIRRQTVKEQGVTGFVYFDQLAKGARFERRIAILEIVDTTFQKRVLGYEFNNTEGISADGDDVHAAVGIMLEDFQYLGGAANARDAVVHGQEHAEGGFGVEAFADHATVARLENV